MNLGFGLDAEFFSDVVSESKKKKEVSDDLLGNILSIEFPIDEEGEPPKPTKKDMKNYDSKKIDRAIRKRIREHNQIIHVFFSLQKVRTNTLHLLDSCRSHG